MHPKTLAKFITHRDQLEPKLGELLTFFKEYSFADEQSDVDQAVEHAEHLRACLERIAPRETADA